MLNEVQDMASCEAGCDRDREAKVKGCKGACHVSKTLKKREAVSVADSALDEPVPERLR